MTDDLEFKMIMALNAADIDDPLCAQAASICAEIAEQHCAQVHQATITPDAAHIPSVAGRPTP